MYQFLTPVKTIEVNEVKENLMKFFKKYRKTLIPSSVALLAVVVIACMFFFSGLGADDSIAVAPTANINPKVDELAEKGAVVLSSETITPTDNTVSTSTPAKNPTEASTAASTAGSTQSTRSTQSATTATAAQNIPFATAMPVETPADYNEQWNQGYLVAIDNPDKTYACTKITLTDEDRDLLERLCMGEFGGGGFVGASLIAQSVKDAMCFDGFTSVAEVIKEYRYTGSTNIGTNDVCRQAVKYVFDENKDAVQHRIMYMYNPYMVQSAFHESQNFILSYMDVRFFDRWGY